MGEIAEKFGAPSITGATPSEARQDAVDRFQEQAAQAAACSPATLDRLKGLSVKALVDQLLKKSLIS